MTKRHGFTLWQALGLLVLLAIAISACIPLVNKAGVSAHRAHCQSNLKQIALAMIIYTTDWDDKHPSVFVKDAAIDNENPLGWADALQPYVRSKQVYWCTKNISNGERDQVEKKPNELDYTDYWYNSRIAGKYRKIIAVSASTILLGEGNDGTDATNARYSLSTLPAAWRTNKSSPAYRHLEGANYAFADGHVKWLRPDKVTGSKPDGKNYTFSIR